MLEHFGLVFSFPVFHPVVRLKLYRPSQATLLCFVCTKLVYGTWGPSALPPSPVNGCSDNKIVELSGSVSDVHRCAGVPATCRALSQRGTGQPPHTAQSQQTVRRQREHRGCIGVLWFSSVLCIVQLPKRVFTWNLLRICS